MEGNAALRDGTDLLIWPCLQKSNRELHLISVLVLWFHILAYYLCQKAQRDTQRVLFPRITWLINTMFLFSSPAIFGFLLSYQMSFKARRNALGNTRKTQKHANTEKLLVVLYYPKVKSHS